jgi:hypothetical protein
VYGPSDHSTSAPFLQGIRDTKQLVTDRRLQPCPLCRR